MAITFITGVARSGKSYFSTYQIYNMYKNELKKVNVFTQWYRYYINPLPPKTYYDTTYTNINQFNFDFHPRIKKLDFHKLVEDLEILHQLQVFDGLTDEDLIVHAKKYGLYNCLIVVDEAAHYFTKPTDKVLIWWLTYHGHLFQDIHIISQHIDQIPSDYLKNGEFFYKVYPPSKAIFKNKFSIGLYSCIKFYKNCKVQDLTIPFVPAVGNLYVSGKQAPRKPILKKFIPIFIGLILFLWFAISNFFSTNDEAIASNHKDDVKIIKSTDINNDNINDRSSLDKKKINKDLSKYKFVEFDCIHDYCFSKQYKKVPISFILFLFENNDLIYVNKKKVNYQFVKYSALLDEPSTSLLDRSFLIVNNKKNDNSQNLQKSPSLF